MAHPGHHAVTRPEGAALVMGCTGDTLSWAELHRRSVAAANDLHDRGLRPGDPIAFCLENRFEFAVLVWASLYAGYRFTPVSTRLTAAEIAYILADCGARIVVHSEACAPAGEAARQAGVEIPVINVDDPHGFPSDPGAAPRYERVEGVAMLYSSGTTGRPKGVWRPAPEAPVEQLPPGDAARAVAFAIDERSVYLSTAPLYHAAPISFMVQMGRLGAATVIMEQFDPDQALSLIERHGVTHSQWVPTMFVRLLRLPEQRRAAFDLSTHRLAIHGAGPCPIPVKQAMLDWWGPIIHEYYAGTEGVGACLIGPHEWLAHRGSVGRSSGAPILILDDDGQPLPPGAIGEVWFSAGSNFRYLNDDAQTDRARTPEGRGTFGDVGYLDPDGYLYLTDRKSFTINSGGINIYPREVEDVLITHPDVVDVAVFGIPHDEYGEEVTAIVQPRDGLAAGPDLADRLADFCRSHLASYKCPRSIEFDDDLPREPTGKLMKQAIRARYLEARR